METFELKYFLAVAQKENIHKASIELSVSTGSLSKAITRLESELKVNLFERTGRNIKLTQQGHILKARASQIIELEMAAKVELGSVTGQLTIVLAGPEVLLSKFGIEFAQKAKQVYPDAMINFVICDESEVQAKINNREAHFGFTSQDISSSDFKTKILKRTHFVTVASAKHPVNKLQSKEKMVSIENVLMYEFVTPNHSILGAVSSKQSLDGWRDDKFPRVIKYKSLSLKIIEELVSQSNVMAYLPDFLVQPYLDTKKWVIINVTGCPYSCEQKIKIIAKSPIESGWIKQLI